MQVVQNEYERQVAEGQLARNAQMEAELALYRAAGSGWDVDDWSDDL